ncbi:MAG: hypothetical protein MK033_06150 [Candidatus Caenarcaniphilales bacterium]|nr:hypothetical protein [Candidatus Caenarcaniphilales bacterium]
MTNQVLTKHELVSKFFKLGDFKFNVNWNEVLFSNTETRLDKLLNPKTVNQYSSGVIFHSTRCPYAHSGPLSLISTRGEDPFGINEAVSRKNPDARFCEKLNYEGFDIFIFVKKQKLVSLIINPYQFLEAFDPQIISEEMYQYDLKHLGTGWSSRTSDGQEKGWISWGSDEKIAKINFYISFYKEKNTNFFKLFSILDKFWAECSQLDNFQEILFDLLPTILILFDLASLRVRSNYNHENKKIIGDMLFDFNRFCLNSGDYAKDQTGNLFKNKRAYKYFKDESKTFLKLVTHSEQARPEVIYKHIKKQVIKKIRDKRCKFLSKLDFNPQAEKEYLLTIFSHKETQQNNFDVIYEMIGTNILKFRHHMGYLTKIQVNSDQLYLYIKENHKHEQNFPISSFFFHFRSILEILKPSLLDFIKQIKIYDLLIFLFYLNRLFCIDSNYEFRNWEHGDQSLPLMPDFEWESLNLKDEPEIGHAIYESWENMEDFREFKQNTYK